MRGVRLTIATMALGFFFMAASPAFADSGVLTSVPSGTVGVRVASVTGTSGPLPSNYASETNAQLRIQVERQLSTATQAAANQLTESGTTASTETSDATASSDADVTDHSGCTFLNSTYTPTDAAAGVTYKAWRAGCRRGTQTIEDWVVFELGDVTVAGPSSLKCTKATSCSLPRFRFFPLDSFGYGYYTIYGVGINKTYDTEDSVALDVYVYET